MRADMASNATESDRAILHGLSARTDLNGCRVTLLKWKEKVSRWVVVVDGTAEKVRVQPKNMVILNVSGGDVDSSSGGSGGDSSSSGGIGCTIRLALHRGLLPCPTDSLRWALLRQIGFEEDHGRDCNMEVFEVDAGALQAYEASVSLLVPVGLEEAAAEAEEKTHFPVEPPALTQLRALLVLFLAPSRAVSSFFKPEGLPAGCMQRGVVGRALVSLVDARAAALSQLSPTEPNASAELVALSRLRATLFRHYGIPPDGPSPHACWVQTQLRALSLPVSRRLPAEPNCSVVAERAVAVLARAASGSGSGIIPAGDSDTTATVTTTYEPLAGRPTPPTSSKTVIVAKGWLGPAALQALRAAALDLVRSRCEPAGVGPSEAVDRAVRRCDAVDLLAPSLWSSLADPLLAICRTVESLRVELAERTGRALLDIAELQLLLYPPGGHYRRHTDVGKSFRAVRRSVSFLLYLNECDWDATADGGQLRVFAARRGAGGVDRQDANVDSSGDNPAEEVDADDHDVVEDVPPSAGTLVLFDSASVPHAVLPTRRERLVLVGWLCEQ